MSAAKTTGNQITESKTDSSSQPEMTSPITDSATDISTANNKKDLDSSV